MAKIIKKRQTSFLGLLLEITGFIIIIVGAPTFAGGGFVGVFIGIILMVVGFGKSRKMVCSECMNRIEDKEVRMCPVCKVTFE